MPPPLSGPRDAANVADVAGGDAQERAEAVRACAGARFVVVTDDQGIRYSHHPNSDNSGKMVSTDPSVALAGGEVTAFERGTLGKRR